MPKGAQVIEGKRVYSRVIGGAIAVAIGLYLLTQKPETNPLGFIAIVIGAIVAFTAWHSVPNPQLLMRYHSDAPKVVAGLIEEWQPDPAKLEADYEKSLYAFLKSKLPFVKITRQYGSARVKCDIAVGADVFIELKRGLRTTNRLQRLIGQIELYRNEWQNKPVFVVLLGESQQDLLHDLNRSSSKYESVKIITKNVAAPAETDEPQQQAASAN